MSTAWTPNVDHIRLLAVNQMTGEETLVSSDCDLRDCFTDPDADDDYYEALNELKRAGRVWLGGGAAQLFLAIRREG